MIGLTIDAIAVGDSAEITRRATEADIAGFVQAVGDDNPLHSDPAYAAGTAFKEPIAPGIWTAGLISAVIGTRLPGPGAVYLSQDLRFTRPVKVGDVICARATVLEANREKNRLRLATVCINQRGEEVLVGEAVVMPSRTSVVYERPVGARRTALAPRALEITRPPLSLWMLAPWAWMAQATAMWMSVGACALADAAGAARSRSAT